MPIYEYECAKCKTHVEILQKITDKPLTKCPKCKGRLEKQWSSTSFQLKGSGWYVTDYASKKAGVGEEKKTGGSEEKKTESSDATASSNSSDKSATKEDKGATKEKESSPAKKSSDAKNTSSASKRSNASSD